MNVVLVIVVVFIVLVVVVRLVGDRKVHVLKVTPHSLKVDRRFNLNFDTAFPTGPARPHGIAVR